MFECTFLMTRSINVTFLTYFLKQLIEITTNKHTGNMAVSFYKNALPSRSRVKAQCLLLNDII